MRLIAKLINTLTHLPHRCVNQVVEDELREDSDGDGLLVTGSVEVAGQFCAHQSS